MNINYTFIFFAFILLCSNAALAYRMFLNTEEADQENSPISKRMILVPAEAKLPESQYILATGYPSADCKLFFVSNLFFCYVIELII